MNGSKAVPPTHGSQRGFRWERTTPVSSSTSQAQTNHRTSSGAFKQEGGAGSAGRPRPPLGGGHRANSSWRRRSPGAAVTASPSQAMSEHRRPEQAGRRAPGGLHSDTHARPLRQTLLSPHTGSPWQHPQQSLSPVTSECLGFYKHCAKVSKWQAMSHPSPGTGPKSTPGELGPPRGQQQACGQPAPRAQVLRGPAGAG